MNTKTQTNTQEHWRLKLERLPSHRDRVAALVALCPQASHLVQTNIALALCIACAPAWDTLQGPGTSSIPDLLRIPRRRACGLLGFSETEESVRLLAKIVPEACSVPLLMRLRHSLRQRGLVKILRHVRVLNPAALLVAAYWEGGDLAGIGLFEEIAAISPGDQSDRLIGLLRDVVEMRRHVGRLHRRLRSIDDLCVWHDRLVEEVNDSIEDDSAEILSMTFPPPPFEGNEQIIPLSTPALLLDEGKCQNNCVVSWCRAINAGECFVYRVNAPERATLGLRYIDGWRIAELRCANNGNVSEQTLREVNRWLYSQGNGSARETTGSTRIRSFQTEGASR